MYERDQQVTLRENIQNGPGALIARSLTIFVSAIGMPVLIYLLIQIHVDVQEATRVTILQSSQILEMQRRIDRLDSRLARIEHREQRSPLP